MNEKQTEKKAPTVKGLDKQLRDQTAAFDDRLSTVEESVEALSDDVKSSLEVSQKNFDELKGMLSTFAKNTPTSITKDGVEVENKGPTGRIQFKEGRPEDDVQLVETTHLAPDSPEFIDKAERLAFDKDMLTVIVHPSQSEFPDHTFTIEVNGKPWLFVRGKPVKAPRCYVETMIRARTSTYDNVERRNPHSNELEVVNTESKSQRFPCQIQHDPNPVQGARWLEGLMNEAA